MARRASGVETELEFLTSGTIASVFGDGGTPETAAFGILGGALGHPRTRSSCATRTARSCARGSRTS